MHESDSFGNTYDKDATYPVIDLASLKDAIKNGGNVAVDADVKVSDKDSLAALFFLFEAHYSAAE